MYELVILIYNYYTVIHRRSDTMILMLHASCYLVATGFIVLNRRIQEEGVLLFYGASPHLKLVPSLVETIAVIIANFAPATHKKSFEEWNWKLFQINFIILRSVVGIPLQLSSLVYCFYAFNNLETRDSLIFGVCTG